MCHKLQLCMKPGPCSCDYLQHKPWSNSFFVSFILPFFPLRIAFLKPASPTWCNLEGVQGAKKTLFRAMVGGMELVFHTNEPFKRMFFAEKKPVFFLTWYCFSLILSINFQISKIYAKKKLDTMFHITISLLSSVMTFWVAPWYLCCTVWCCRRVRGLGYQNMCGMCKLSWASML